MMVEKSIMRLGDNNISGVRPSVLSYGFFRLCFRLSQLETGWYYPTEELIYPPLSVQKKIAGILSAYDDLIENNRRRIQILEEMARNLYREWFVNFRFPIYRANGTIERFHNPETAVTPNLEQFSLME